MIEIIEADHELRKQWVDNFGNDLESTKMYRDANISQEARVNRNFLPIAGESVLTWLRRARRASIHMSDVQECHFNGTQKVFFCHKNPATCWVCDLNTMLLFFTKMGEQLQNLMELREVFEKTTWDQVEDGSFRWVFRP